MLAAGALLELRARGLQIPDDVSLASFFESDHIRYVAPAITCRGAVEALYGWRANPPGHGRIAVMTGDLSYLSVDPPLREQEFIAQRELSAREVARAMRVPAFDPKRRANAG